MPLFMMVSGFVAKDCSPSYQTLKKGFNRLIVPYIAWAIIVSIQFKSTKHIINVFLHPDNGLWFLWVLFFIKIIYSSIVFIKEKYGIQIWISVIGTFVVLSVLSLKIGSLFCIQLMAIYIIYYAIGRWLRKSDFHQRVNLVVSLGVLAVCLIVIPYLSQIFNHLDSMGIIFQKVSRNLERFVIGIPLSIAWFVIFRYIKTLPNIFSTIGKETLGIYAIHFVIINATPRSWISNWSEMSIIPLAIIIIFISMVIIYLLKQTKITRQLFLGQ